MFTSPLLTGRISTSTTSSHNTCQTKDRTKGEPSLHVIRRDKHSTAFTLFRPLQLTTCFDMLYKKSTVKSNLLYLLNRKILWAKTLIIRLARHYWPFFDPRFSDAHEKMRSIQNILFSDRLPYSPVLSTSFELLHCFWTNRDIKYHAVQLYLSTFLIKNDRHIIKLVLWPNTWNTEKNFHYTDFTLWKRIPCILYLAPPALVRSIFKKFKRV